MALDNGGKIQMWAGSWANTNLNTPSGYFVMSAVFNTTNSSLSLNGTSVTGLSVGSYNLTNGITIGANCNANADYLDGSIAEFLVLDETSDASTISKVEGYLAHKWELTSNLPSSHPYALGAPTLSGGSPDYITDTPFGSGKAIDLSNGHVEVSTKEMRMILMEVLPFRYRHGLRDGQVKAGPIITKGAKLPDPSSVPGMKLFGFFRHCNDGQGYILGCLWPAFQRKHYPVLGRQIRQRIPCSTEFR